ncbi:MAG: SH3 domain-containing protein [Clostridia bacterium]|nr:SH3 domain-containing protein [Clostridia bacterium]
MKRNILIASFLMLCLLCTAASADKARFLSSDGNSSYHASHLAGHEGLIDCRISANYLKVRTAPNGANVLGHVEQADTIELIEISGKWAQIRVTYSAPTSPDSWNGLQGWVDADYVECPCSYQDYYETFSGDYPDGVIDGSGVNVRELPGANTRTLFTVSRGTQVVVLGSYQASDGTWYYRILTGGKTGFVRQDLISYTGSSTLPIAEEGLPNQGGIGANPGMPTYIPNGAMLGELLHDSTNVRQSAGGTVSGRLRRGTVVAILSSTNDRDGIQWYYVSYGNDQRGYIRGDLVEITGTPTYYSTPTPAPYYPYATATPVPYYPYATATPAPYYPYATATPVPYYPFATATPAVSQSYGSDYNTAYNTYVLRNWAGSADRTLVRDIDGDGVPELFIWDNGGVRNVVYIYTFKNGYVIPLNTAFTIGGATLAAGRDKDTNGIGGGGFVYFTSYGIGFLAGGADSASDESYSYYLKSGYALVKIRNLVIRRSSYGTTYLLDGRSVSQSDVQQFLSVFVDSNEILQ